MNRELEAARQKVVFLEENMSQLKQDLVYWTRKPATTTIKTSQNADGDYVMMLEKIQALKRSNQKKEEELKTIKSKPNLTIDIPESQTPKR